jgi:hypothetical protein
MKAEVRSPKIENEGIGMATKEISTLGGRRREGRAGLHVMPSHEA